MAGDSNSRGGCICPIEQSSNLLIFTFDLVPLYHVCRILKIDFKYVKIIMRAVILASIFFRLDSGNN